MFKNFKVFGKINLLDLTLIVIVFSAVFFLGDKLKNKSNVSSVSKEMSISLFAEQIPDYVANAIVEGAPIKDDAKNVNLGYVTSFEKDKGYIYVTDDNGIVKKGFKENYSSVIVNAKINAQEYENGILINGNSYSIGSDLTVLVGKAKFLCRISDIEE